MGQREAGHERAPPPPAPPPPVRNDPSRSLSRRASHPVQSRPMSILAIDYGTRRIGIAVSTSGVLATPHSIIPNDGDLAAVVERIAALGEEIGAERFLVGLPRRTRSGSDDPALAPYRALADALGQKTRKEVVLWDEGFSTTEAASRRRERGGRSRRRRSESIDMEAAAIILQSFLDEAGRR